MSQSYEDWREERLEAARQHAAELAAAVARRANLENVKHAVVAMAQIDAERQGFHTVSAQAREAHSSDEYREWCEAHAAAVEEAERLRLEWRVIEMEFEYWRTTRADRRAEMQMT